MSQKVVTIIIDEDGNSSLDLAGFQGKGCANVAKEFRGPDILRKSVQKREYSVELPQQVKVNQ